MGRNDNKNGSSRRRSALLRRAKFVLALGVVLAAGLLASGAFGRVLIAGSSTDSTPTLTDPTSSDSTSTDATPTTDPTDSTSTETDTTPPTDTTPTTTDTTPGTTTTTPAVFSPTITSDQPDYSPGATVTLTGAGWAPFDAVHVFVNDDEGQTWSYNTDVSADLAGGFTLQFRLPSTFVAAYSVTATGALSGTAKTTFTDGNVTLHLSAAEGVANMTVTYDRWNGNTTCTGTATLTNQTVTATSGGTVNIPGFGGSGDSVKLKSVSTTTPGKAFSSWTSGDKNTDSGTLVPGSPTPCISNSGAGSNGNVTDAYAHFVNSAATLTVIKHVVNDNGGTATASSFTMSVPGGTPASFAGADSPGTTVTIPANTAYSVGETGPNGYTRSDSAGCTSASGIAPGGSATCTVTNNDQAATLTVIKHVVNNNGGTATAGNWSLHVKSGASEVAGSPQAGSESGTTYTLNAGSYTVSETGGPSGYAASFSAACSGGNVSLSLGDAKTCTLTNDDQAPTLTVIKHVINNNGGTATASSFTMSVSGGTPASFAGAESPGTNVTLTANAAYSVGETGPAGYTRSDSAGCASAGGLAPGATATCTITNDDQPAMLTVIKHVVNDNGGTATAANFTMSVAGGSPASFPGAESPGTTVSISANTAYSVGESGPSGYARSDSAGCTSASGLAPGASATCTVTNNDQPATLTVIKHVINNNGGTAAAASFAMSVSGGNPSPANFAGAESPGTSVTINANAGYSVGETGPTGYTRSDSPGCTSASGLAPGASATCTVTNDDQPATLTVIKHVVNDNGGSATAGSFTMTVAGGTPASFAGAESPGTAVTINANSAYSVGETGPVGYARSDSPGCTSATGLAPGGFATCTVTNNDIQPTLHVIKHVVNDNGGTATASSFTMSVTGDSPSPASFAGAESPGTTVHLNAGSYSIGESGPSGYASSASAGCSGSLSAGDEKTCTITNDDVQPTLHVIKHVINDNGGTATASSFTMSVTGGSPDPASFAGNESGTTVHLNAGSYSVGESGPSGYARSDSADCAGSISVGDDKTCTVTNDDIVPILHVIKHVINDNGGTKSASDFTMSVTGSSPDPASFAGNESGTTVHLNAGSYSVGESGPSGYASSASAGCSGSLSVGDEKTCTITNDDVQPTLHVIKHVINDNGGTATASSFTMSVTGSGPTPDSFAGEESGTTVHLDAGSYSVGESGPSGYARSDSGDCAGSIAVGDDKTCTITNDDIQPALHVIKHVVNDNGGTATASSFTMSVIGSSPSPDSFPGDESGTTVHLDAGSYSVGEGGPSGYAASNSADCAGTLSVGDDKTCTITNDDIQPILHVIKHVVNDNGGTKSASDFTMSVTGNSPDPASFAGAESPGTTVHLNAGSYSIGETGPAGYARTDSADCAGSLSVGDEKTCTVTNNDVQPILHVIKHVINDNGGTKSASDFTMSVTGGSPDPATFAGDEGGTIVHLDAGAYSVGESGPSGYARSDSGDCAGSLSVGDDKTCTVTNDDIQPILHVIKHVINDNGGTKNASDFTMSVTANSPDPATFAGDESGTTVHLNAGTYSIGESGPSGYASSASADCAGSLSVGDEKTCTVTNDDIQPILHIIKHVVNDNGGAATASDFSMSVTGASPTPDSFPGDESGTTVHLNAGSYSVGESGPLGYARSDSADCAGSLSVGDDKTCTITNDDIQPTLHVIKHVVNNNGGTATASSFTMSVIGSSPSPDSFPGDESGTTVHLDAGSYSVGESGPSGYARSDSGDCAGSLSVGDEKTCTVTNDDIQPILHVTKHVVNDNGGTATAGDFTLNAGNATASPASFAGDEGGTTVHLDAGAYQVSESGPSGYDSSFSADCSGSIAIGEEKSCTVTNDDIQPILHVIKHVINDNGGTKNASDFTLSVSGQSPSPNSFAGAEAPGTDVALNAGSYSVSEGSHTGYDASTSADCSGSISIGQTKTCTITNDDIQPVLHVIKHVINDNGGTATASTFTMSVTGSSPNPSNFAGDENGTTVHLNAGAYHVTESGSSGYASSFSDDCSTSIAVGEEKTCTVTNDDIQPKLIVIKHVINDNGGTKNASDFTLNVNGNAASPSSFHGDEAGTQVALDAGSYSVSEPDHDGYTSASSSDCTGSIAVGETKTCTVTNDDIQPILHVIKHVINDNGGTKNASDFTLSVTGNGASPASFSGSESGTTVHLNAGSYSVDEGAVSGYAKSTGSDCSGSIAVGQEKTCTITNDDLQPKLIVIKHVINDNGGTKSASDFTMGVTGASPTPGSFPGAEAPGQEVAINAGSYNVTESGPNGYASSFSADCTGSISVGQTKTCTVTNDDIQPKLTVIKHVINDNGGPASASSFTMSVTGPGATPATFPGSEGGTDVKLNAGSYSVDESGPGGYSRSDSADCTGSIAIGQTKTCTVTNNDIQPKLYVIKHVINDNGGTATASNFTMSVTGSSPSPGSFPGAEAPGTLVALNAGSYSVGESTSLTGYAYSSSQDCTGSIAVGQTKTCTFTNDDIQPKLTVIKHVINDDGGTKTASNFTMNVTGSSPSPASFPGAEAPGTQVALNAGSYSVDEAAMAGYTKSLGANCSGSIAIGETKSCTITNDDVNQAPVITSFTGTNSFIGPLVFAPSAFAGTFTDSGVADNPWVVNWSWDGVADAAATQNVGANGTTSHNFGPQTHTYSSTGCNHTATVKITDKDGAFDTKTISLQVGTGAFLPPMTNQPVTNKLKNGQVLPVKVQITDCNGAGVNNLQPAIRLIAGDQTAVFDDSAVTITPTSVSSADTTGVMRSNGADGSYIYNMNISIALNTDYTVVVYPYGITNTGVTLRHVIQATK